jgi:hypothetical protein
MIVNLLNPANVFFGHLLAIVIGILFNEFLGMSYLTLGLSVGTTCNTNDVF